MESIAWAEAKIKPPQFLNNIWETFQLLYFDPYINSI